MTTYTDFKSYYLRKVWRVGDAELTADLDNLVREAESRIKRDLRDNSLATTAVLTINAGNAFTLPGDFRELITGSINGKRMASALPLGELHRTTRDFEGAIDGSGYAIIGDKLFTRGNALVTNPGTMSITYYMDLTPYASNPLSPFYDKHPDFYLSALNVYVYDYLREFDLKGQNEQAYNDTLDSMVRNSNYARWPSGQIAMGLPI